MPLEWPTGWPRTPAEQRKRGYNFNRPVQGSYGRRRPTVSEGVRDVVHEVRLLGGTDLKISTSLGVKADGLPRSSDGRPTDPGVAVYFRRHGRPLVFACDAYDDAGVNLRAIGLTLEAKRGIERWGCATAEREFQGYAALPGPEHFAADGSARVADSPSGFLVAVEQPWAVLGVAEDAPPEVVDAAYRTLAKRAHPDAGGSHEAMTRLNQARDAMHARRRPA